MSIILFKSALIFGLLIKRIKPPQLRSRMASQNCGNDEQEKEHLTAGIIGVYLKKFHS